MAGGHRLPSPSLALHTCLLVHAMLCSQRAQCYLNRLSTSHWVLVGESIIPTSPWTGHPSGVEVGKAHTKVHRSPWGRNGDQWQSTLRVLAPLWRAGSLWVPPVSSSGGTDAPGVPGPLRARCRVRCPTRARAQSLGAPWRTRSSRGRQQLQRFPKRGDRDGDPGFRGGNSQSGAKWGRCDIKSGSQKAQDSTSVRQELAVSEPEGDSSKEQQKGLRSL